MSARRRRSVSRTRCGRSAVIRTQGTCPRPAGRRPAAREVIRLEPADGGERPAEARVGSAVYAYVVDAKTYEPVRWEVSPTQWYDYTAYEYLPSHAQTRQLL